MQKKILNNSQFSEQETKEYFHQARFFRKILESALQKEVGSIQNAMKYESDYDKPGWSALHADRLGQIKALERVIKMIEVEIETKNS